MKEAKKAAENIRRIRKGLKMSQSELAAKVGTVQQGIARIESGKQNMTLNLLCRISEALGVNISELIK